MVIPKRKLWALEMILLGTQPTGWERCGSCSILHDPIYYTQRFEVAHLASCKRGHILYGSQRTERPLNWIHPRSSSYDLIDRHWFLRRYLVVFKVSFHDDGVTPGVTATSALTSTECQRHTSSVWPWSGTPKVGLYYSFLGGLHHLPPQKKNQHGLNEKKPYR